MPIREEPWPHGTPSLLTLTCTNPRAAAEVYANLLGWELTADGATVVARVLGRPVAAFLPGDDAHAWATHLTVEDIYTASATARVAGAQMSNPVDLAGEGRYARGTDPSGAILGFWEPNEPATPVGETGTLLWSELLVRDLDSAARFYDVAMDLTVQRPQGEPWATLHTRDGELIARVGVIGDEFPPDLPAHWMPYLDVPDLDEAFGLGGAFGASPLLDPGDSDFGRIAIMRGLAGEVFGLLEISDEVALAD